MLIRQIDFVERSLMRQYKKKYLRITQRHVVEKLTPVRISYDGHLDLGFTAFQEGATPQQFRIYLPDRDAWASIPKQYVLEIDGYEIQQIMEG